MKFAFFWKSKENKVKNLQKKSAFYLKKVQRRNVKFSKANIFYREGVVKGTYS